jgi:hypothetical protein
MGLRSAIKTYADTFVAFIVKYMPGDGGLAEQFLKTDRTPLSMVDLTWGHASLLTAFNVRNGTVPPSWGAGGRAVPHTCQRGPHACDDCGWGSVNSDHVITGVYCCIAKNIYLSGSINMLQQWHSGNVPLLSAEHYLISCITVNILASTVVQYKHIYVYINTVHSRRPQLVLSFGHAVPWFKSLRLCRHLCPHFMECSSPHSICDCPLHNISHPDCHPQPPKTSQIHPLKLPSPP